MESTWNFGRDSPKAEGAAPPSTPGGGATHQVLDNAEGSVKEGTKSRSARRQGQHTHRCNAIAPSFSHQLMRAFHFTMYKKKWRRQREKLCKHRRSTGTALPPSPSLVIHNTSFSLGKPCKAGEAGEPGQPTTREMHRDQLF